MQTKNDLGVNFASTSPDTSLTKLSIKQMGFSISDVSALKDNDIEVVLAKNFNKTSLRNHGEFKQQVCQSIYPYMPYDLDGYAIKAVTVVGFCEPKRITIQQQSISFSDFQLILQVQYDENQLNIDDESMAEIRGELLDLLHVDLVFEQLAFEVNYLYDVVIMDIENPPADMTPIISLH